MQKSLLYIAVYMQNGFIIKKAYYSALLQRVKRVIKTSAIKHFNTMKQYSGLFLSLSLYRHRQRRDNQDRFFAAFYIHPTKSLTSALLKSFARASTWS